MMDRRELVLAALAPARGKPHSPVQVQKLLFLIDQNIHDLVDGPHFEFEPHNYGPFDKEVYEDLEALAVEGYIDISFAGPTPWRNYRLTEKGQDEGEAQLADLPATARDYIQRASEFVRQLSFTELVSAIYRDYPDMRANSVFQG